MSARDSRAQTDAEKDKLGDVVRDANTSPEEKAAAIAEIKRLESEQLDREAEAGEETVLGARLPEVVEPGEARVAPDTDEISAEEAEANRERIAEVQDGTTDEEDVVEGAVEAAEDHEADAAEVAAGDKPSATESVDEAQAEDAE